MQRAGLLGSGFGLYGYLPALLEAGAGRIVLPEQYRPAYVSRPGLASYSSNIDWVPGKDGVFAQAETLVVAQQPGQQVLAVQRALRSSGVKYLLLEKPLAPSPATAIALTECLRSGGKHWRIAYLFRFTEWGKKLRATCNGEARPAGLTISWTFHAHHFRHNLANWKRHHAEGGGVLRFYGIHMIALLAEIGYNQVSQSNLYGRNANEPEKWEARFSGAGLPVCEITVDSRNGLSRFDVVMANAPGNGVIAGLSDPFSKGESDRLVPSAVDSRVEPLVELCSSLWREEACFYPWYDNVLALWADTEELTRFNAVT